MTETECDVLAGSLQDKSVLDEAIDLEAMSQGRGELRRFRDPLTDDLSALRASLYERLVGTANRWQEAIGDDARYPGSFGALSKQRRTKGRPMERSALSRLGAGDHWGLHQDAESDDAFPLQVSALLSRPGRQFSGGEFVMTEQRPRMQSRPIVVVPKQGDAIILATHRKPFRGAKGFYRVSLKHAVSRVLSGYRVALELLFDGAS
ncbi:2OG-Fe(II) oxygenase [Labilithrix luteola]|uniref:2OG-Fe(II) oxygenase n=1 Tax=Labilithrix luteola TaxID=1391654 RepID=UPI001969C0A9|nr:2OG-Fe(II) oxygenase [Labilithrix luteola]